MQGKSQKEQMLEIVKSEKVRVLIEDRLKSYDKRALTNNGIIKSYEIDEKTIKHNPMGGIMFDIIVNDSISMVGKMGIQKDGGSKQLSSVGMDESAGLQALVGE